MNQHSFLIPLGLSLLCSSQLVLAHAEHDKARYVAQSGKDAGKCDNPVRPCQSIHYAVQQANKGDKVLVASGHYAMSNESDLFYLQSQLVPVKGGFNKFDHFQVQSPDVNQTVLTGVPEVLRETLSDAGFKVIADTKGADISADLSKRLANFEMLSQAQQNLSCNNGQAGNFACNKVDLVSHTPMATGVSGSDVWGHVDLNSGIEYAIMGYSNGTKVFSLANPENPVEVGHISGSRTSWRDIKVYQYFDTDFASYRAYAYVTSEGSDGIQIIDLNNLPQSVTLAKRDSSVGSAHNIYISNVDYTLNSKLTNAEPAVQIVGAKTFGGAFLSYLLSDAKNITRVYTPAVSSRSNYTHDATSIQIDDERNQRDCINGTAFGCTLMVDFNENEVRFWDVTNPQKTQELSSIGYDDVAKEYQYVHSGWFSDDKQYVFVHDEWDENYGGLNTTVRVLNIEDLNTPTLAGMWQGPTKAIDHNGFVRGNRYYMSNYERGLTILDITDPTTPHEVGFFDSFPSSDNNAYHGAWGVYPYLPSGLILLSDINSGLYVLKEHTRDVAKGSLSFQSATIASARDTTLSIAVSRNKTDGTATKVGYETIPGSAQHNVDYQGVKGVLEWGGNDIADKSFDIAIKAATPDELKQSFFVRLFDPKNGVTLGEHHYLRINLAGKLNSGKVSFSPSKNTIAENQGNYTATVIRTGGSEGELSINYNVVPTSASVQDIETTQGTLTWADGDISNKTIRFNIIDDTEPEQNEVVEIQLSHDTDASLIEQKTFQVTILDDENNQAPSVDAGPDFEESTNISFDYTGASVNDAENDLLTYSWKQLSGPTVTLTQVVDHVLNIKTGSEAGDCVIELTVTDERGASTRDSVTLKIVGAEVVTPPPPPPVVIPEEPKKSSSGGALSIFSLLAMFIGIRRIKKRV
ncbi:choice-of-anchor B family protein [Pseudoalteromonas tunicata]|uniref:choice-of-anchor B family protein n=1 Tax=Pseudoalteromonas tunicata TaxID=314281 RepID=UPI00273D06A4|nr:choice-of-anchor B family protein [Pseudoalteromonas tunicata]MDP5214556.1 choice-of-anchor B family protein [Pseudoalteromonas tunicata]